MQVFYYRNRNTDLITTTHTHTLLRYENIGMITATHTDTVVQT